MKSLEVAKSRQSLYHKTNIESLTSIIGSGSLTSSNDWVSMTRDSSYNVKGTASDVCMEFDWDAFITKGYKIKCYSYPFPKSREDHSVANSQTRRLEAEQLVKAPVKLKGVLIRITAGYASKKYLASELSSVEAKIKDCHTMLEFIRKDSWGREAYVLYSEDNYSQAQWDKFKTKDKDWRPFWFSKEVYDKNMSRLQSDHKDLDDVLRSITFI